MNVTVKTSYVLSRVVSEVIYLYLM